jgi:hypothetical protein
MLRTIALGLLGLGLAGEVRAQDAQTVIAERGKLMVSEDLGVMPANFKVGKGKWEVVDGALRGSELAVDAHAATFRRPTPAHNVIIQYSFKIDGDAKTSLSINSSKGHLSRMQLSPNSLTVKKDSSDKNKTDKSAILDTYKGDIKAGVWHTVVLEQVAGEMLASLDGKTVAYGKHEGVNQPITNIGFTVTGQSVSFKNLRIWEAGAVRASWPAEREKWIQARSK